ncbi:hypothetical protein [Flavobacterium sp.]|uniref:hypothetical protein n=1 Tax=Flavobacterium sp. TaxID=239 RepID=UPI0039E41F15
MNWIVIVLVVVFAITLIVYLIRQNKKDEKTVVEFFNRETPDHDEESELNNEK